MGQASRLDSQGKIRWHRFKAQYPLVVYCVLLAVAGVLANWYLAYNPVDAVWVLFMKLGAAVVAVVLGVMFLLLPNVTSRRIVEMCAFETVDVKSTDQDWGEAALDAIKKWQLKQGWGGRRTQRRPKLEAVSLLHPKEIPDEHKSSVATSLGVRNRIKCRLCEEWFCSGVDFCLRPFLPVPEGKHTADVLVQGDGVRKQGRLHSDGSWLVLGAQGYADDNLVVPGMEPIALRLTRVAGRMNLTVEFCRLVKSISLYFFYTLGGQKYVFVNQKYLAVAADPFDKLFGDGQTCWLLRGAEVDLETGDPETGKVDVCLKRHSLTLSYPGDLLSSFRLQIGGLFIRVRVNSLESVDALPVQVDLSVYESSEVSKMVKDLERNIPPGKGKKKVYLPTELPRGVRDAIGDALEPGLDMGSFNSHRKHAYIVNGIPKITEDRKAVGYLALPEESTLHDEFGSALSHLPLLCGIPFHVGGVDGVNNAYVLGMECNLSITVFEGDDSNHLEVRVQSDHVNGFFVDNVFKDNRDSRKVTKPGELSVSIDGKEFEIHLFPMSKGLALIPDSSPWHPRFSLVGQGITLGDHDLEERQLSLIREQCNRLVVASRRIWSNKQVFALGRDVGGLHVVDIYNASEETVTVTLPSKSFRGQQQFRLGPEEFSWDKSMAGRPLDMGIPSGRVVVTDSRSKPRDVMVFDSKPAYGEDSLVALTARLAAEKLEVDEAWRPIKAEQFVRDDVYRVRTTDGWSIVNFSEGVLKLEKASGETCELGRGVHPLDDSAAKLVIDEGDRRSIHLYSGDNQPMASVQAIKFFSFGWIERNASDSSVYKQYAQKSRLPMWQAIGEAGNTTEVLEFNTVEPHFNQEVLQVGPIRRGRKHGFRAWHSRLNNQSNHSKHTVLYMVGKSGQKPPRMLTPVSGAVQFISSKTTYICAAGLVFGYNVGKGYQNMGFAPKNAG